MLQVEGWPKPVEQSLAAAQHDRRDDDGQLIDMAAGKRLADDVGAAHDVDGLVTCRLVGVL